MSAPLGRVTLYETGGIHTYVMSDGGSVEINCDNMKVRLSAEGLHRLLDFLTAAGYCRTPIPKQTTRVQRTKEQAIIHECINLILDETGGSLTHIDDLVGMVKAMVEQNKEKRKIDSWTCGFCGFFDPEFKTTVHECSAGRDILGRLP